MFITVHNTMESFQCPPVKIKNNINNMIHLYDSNTFKVAVNWWVLRS